MGKYYKTTPWVIPAVPEKLKHVFIKHGEKISVKKNSTVAGSFSTLKEYMGNSPCTVNDMIYLKSGMLGQVYETYDENKPMAISLVLPDRMVNYAAYAGIDNSKEVLITLKNSEMYHIALDEFMKLTGSIKDDVFHYCMSCIASDYDAFTCMFSCNTEKRCAFLYRSLADSFGASFENGWLRIPIKLSYSVIAAVMYTTKKTIERLIPAWQEAGLFKSDKDSTLINPELFKSILI